MNWNSCQSASSNNTPNVMRGQYMDFHENTLTALANGTDVNIAFPRVRVISNEFTFVSDVVLLGLFFSSSLVNVTAGESNVLGLFVVSDQAPIIDINGASKVFFAHKTFQNSSNTIINPTSRSNGISFGNDAGVRLNSGVPISIYACGFNDAANLFAGTLSMIWTPLV